MQSTSKSGNTYRENETPYPSSENAATTHSPLGRCIKMMKAPRRGVFVMLTERPIFIDAKIVFRYNLRSSVAANSGGYANFPTDMKEEVP